MVIRTGIPGATNTPSSIQSAGARTKITLISLPDELLVKIFWYYHCEAPPPDDIKPRRFRKNQDRRQYLNTMAKIAACKRLYVCAIEAYFARPEGFELGFIIFDDPFGSLRGTFIGDCATGATFAEYDMYFRKVSRIHLPLLYYPQSLGSSHLSSILGDVFREIESILLKCEKLVKVDVWYDTEYMVKTEWAEAFHQHLLGRLVSEVGPKLEEKAEKLGKSFRLEVTSGSNDVGMGTFAFDTSG